MEDLNQMGNQLSTQQKQEIYNIGREFAYENLNIEDFNSQNPEEIKIFLEGYNAALEEQKDSLNIPTYIGGRTR